MTHPLIPQITELATPVAAELGLEVVNVNLYTHHRPPTLQIDVRNSNGDISLDDCANMSRVLDDALEAANLIPYAYTLEISSPGAPTNLTTDREFEVFQGFTVSIQLDPPHKGKTEFKGQLKERNETSILLTQKGRIIDIPRDLVQVVMLDTD